MNLATMFAIFAVTGTEAEDPGEAPTGPPTGVSHSYYGSPQKVRLHWVNEDSAYTRIYGEQGTCPGTPPFVWVVNPGVTSYDSSFLESNDPHRFKLTHYKNGQESAKTDCYQAGGEE